ncbi:hypothetical protein DENSPDRAFT_887240 [Dentipellis sp. KUC8613]|nr:hypothetical protein DENSPDRAFT_887240 [Dentipellis sp. KUC8613]
MPPATVHNKHYFVAHDTVVLRVENELFRVHRRYLQEYSIFFEDLFSLASMGASGEGTCDENPIYLSATVLEFETLMDAFYSPHLFESDVYFTRERSVALRRIADFLLIELDDLITITWVRLVTSYHSSKPKLESPASAAAQSSPSCTS